MPCFYFDASVGKNFTRDDHGLELESLDEAEAEALRAAAGISHGSVPKGDCSNVGVQVMDEHGQPVLTVAVAMAVHRMAQALA